jgi:hypothetical protein
MSTGSSPAKAAIRRASRVAPITQPGSWRAEKGDSKVIIQAMTEVGAFFLDKASRLYEQRPMRFSSSCSHNMAPSIFSVSFELTGQSKRNLINVLT